MANNNAINSYFEVGSSQEVAQPGKPAFLGYKASTSSNVTGNGIVYSNVGSTEVFDKGSDYANGTSTFTAPVTGSYKFYGSVKYGGSPGASDTNTRFNSSNRYILGANFRYGALRDASTNISVPIACICDMDAADTIIIEAISSQNPPIIDILGSASPSLITFFSGYLEG